MAYMMNARCGMTAPSLTLSFVVLLLSIMMHSAHANEYPLNSQQSLSQPVVMYQIAGFQGSIDLSLPYGSQTLQSPYATLFFDSATPPLSQPAPALALRWKLTTSSAYHQWRPVLKFGEARSNFEIRAQSQGLWFRWNRSIY